MATEKTYLEVKMMFLDGGIHSRQQRRSDARARDLEKLSCTSNNAQTSATLTKRLFRSFRVRIALPPQRLFLFFFFFPSLLDEHTMVLAVACAHVAGPDRAVVETVESFLDR